MSVIIAPPSNFRVELGNEIPCCGLLVRLDDFSDALQKRVDVLFGGGNQPFSVVFSEMLSEKIKAVLNVRDERFLLGECEPAFPHELLHGRFYFVFQDLFRLACHDKIIGKANKIDLLITSSARMLWKLPPKFLFKTI